MMKESMFKSCDGYLQPQSIAWKFWGPVFRIRNGIDKINSNCFCLRNFQISRQESAVFMNKIQLKGKSQISIT